MFVKKIIYTGIYCSVCLTLSLSPTPLNQALNQLEANLRSLEKKLSGGFMPTPAGWEKAMSTYLSWAPPAPKKSPKERQEELDEIVREYSNVIKKYQLRLKAIVELTESTDKNAFAQKLAAIEKTLSSQNFTKALNELIKKLREHQPRRDFISPEDQKYIIEKINAAFPFKTPLTLPLLPHLFQYKLNDDLSLSLFKTEGIKLDQLKTIGKLEEFMQLMEQTRGTMQEYYLEEKAILNMPGVARTRDTQGKPPVSFGKHSKTAQSILNAYREVTNSFEDFIRAAKELLNSDNEQEFNKLNTKIRDTNFQTAKKALENYIEALSTATNNETQRLNEQDINFLKIKGIPGLKSWLGLKYDPKDKKLQFGMTTFHTRRQETGKLNNFIALIEAWLALINPYSLQEGKIFYLK